MQPELLTLGQRSLETLEVWQGAFAAIQGVGIALDAPNAHTPDVTLGEVNECATAALSALAQLRDVSPEQLVLISHRLRQVTKALKSIEAQSKNLAEVLWPWGGATALDRNGHLQIEMQHPERGQQVFDLGSPLSTIYQSTEALLDLLPYIGQVGGDKNIQVFANIARITERGLVNIRDATTKAGKELESSKATAAELEKLTEKAEHLVKQVHVLLAATTSQKSSVDENAAEVQQKLAMAREVSKDADTLQQRVTGFASQFEAFESQMKARLEQFTEFEEATQEAEKKNKEREEKISGLAEKADTMIRGATTAGLSKSLEDTRDSYEKRLARTQWFFLGSVIFLLASALPIAAQIIPGPWQPYFSGNVSETASDSVLWLSTIGKMVLVLPGTWATAFFASNYAELFHLSREYAHKAAMAKAIDGFKREAPTYEEEIVGAVFMEIQDNPGSRKAPAAATPQNPIISKFLPKVIDAIRRKSSS